MMIDTHVHVVSGDLVRYPLNPGPSTNPWYVQPVGAYQFDNEHRAVHPCAVHQHADLRDPSVLGIRA